ncbi:radical SAM protein [Cellulosilyticum sp. ST5]|uniref:radical SAM protein n=1 Tax=unclassified Cellulosilyticum TaxID=2643091 RepID=UPI000F8D94B0|nr:radical SAM protein [Cellulosilyticum sp. WCF-2]QEH69087.1 radical SAM protein [Cellulosilyticum sp. WCF-2]
MQGMLEACQLCPRGCRVNRTKGEKGYCRQTSEVMIARAALHLWEEPCLTGENGSGTLFFSGCTLGCVYCQNRSIATSKVGKVISITRLVEIFFELKAQGAHNINLVTGTHFIPQIVEALQLAKDKGLELPIVYNTSGYEKVESLQLLRGYVDIYLPDLKYKDEILSTRYSYAKDYFEYASKAIAEMVSQVGMPTFDEGTGLMKKGVMVRHLCLPGAAKDTKAILRYLYQTYGDTIYMSIMNQFTPICDLQAYPEISRRLTEREYNHLIDYALDLGIEQAFIQEGETAKESFIPEFDLQGV